MNNLFDKHIIENSTIMVVGCGTLGNEVLKNLALMGVGNIFIVDFDKIEEINLSGSPLFCMQSESLGKFKVDIAAKALKMINPKVKVTPIRGNFIYDVGLGLIKKMDVIISCVDNRWTRFIINRYCQATGQTWIDGGITEFEGTVKTLSPGRQCYACLIGEKEQILLQKRFSCPGIIRRNIKQGHAPLNSLISSVIGALQVNEALKIISNKKTEKPKFDSLEGKILTYNCKENNFFVASFEAWDEECVEHEIFPEPENCNLKISDTISETLHKVKSHYGVSDVSIILTREPFVTDIIDITDNKEYQLNVPASKVEEYISEISEINSFLLANFRQREWHEIDSSFKQPGITLKKIGIPVDDIVPFKISGEEHFILVR